MSRHIDADALKEDLIHNRSFYPAIVKSAIENAPTADVVEVRHGKWIFKEYGEDTYTNLTRIYECSLCGRTIERLNEADEPYCHCGAKMDGERRMDND